MVTAASHLASPETALLEIERESKLRIGIVTHYMPPHLGGIELVAQALFDTYKAAGFELRWLASRVPRTAESRDAEKIRAPCLNVTERCLGVPWPIWGPAGVREADQLVKWADIVHVHDCLYFGSAAAVFLAHRAHKPVLLSQHIGFGWYSSRILNWTEHLAYQTLGRAVLRRVSHLVFCTPAAEEFITPLLGNSVVPASSIPIGIDTNRFRPPTLSERVEARKSLGLPESKRVILFVGRLQEKKGASLFLEVSRSMPTHHFLIVGDGPIRPSNAENLTWLPFVEPSRMGMIYQAADALLLPSYSEGFPLSVLEAMASGVPVIIPAGEAFAASLERLDACLISERTPESLCQALGRLWETPGLATAIAARARALAVRERSLNTMGERYVNVIREMVG